jgi:hypothetical protein
MAKYHGKVGYAELNETAPGVWSETIIEREYNGDLLQNSRRLQTTDQVNSDLTISNRISIVADPFAITHFHTMRYAEYAGVKWTVTNAEVAYPRLVLTLGGVYNGVQQT